MGDSRLGACHIGCTKTDIYNYERDLQNAVKGHDAELLYEYFKSEQEKNSSFTFKIKAGDDDRIIHCFWADVVSRHAYKYFGDVVVFDTTYNTNRYGIIFAPLIRVNHHGQSIVFACAFLGDETIDSFLWLFDQFKEAMPGSAPKMIIIDQDPAMTKVIAQVFPNTYHRFCIWHILNKFSEKLNAVIYRDHYSKWLELIENCKLHENGWFQSLYEIRSKWVPVFVNHIFSTGMSSSQRAKSCHFKKYVSKKNSLMDFILRFNRTLAHQRHEELIADHTDSNGKPMSFYIFQDEPWNTLVYKIDKNMENDDCCVYNVDKRNEPGGFPSCSCKKFDSEGIPYRHLLSYINLMQVAFLPSHYILKRWTKAAKCDVVVDDKGTEISDFQDKLMLTRCTRLFQLASNVIENVVASEEASKILEDDLNNVLSKVKSVFVIYRYHFSYNLFIFFSVKLMDNFLRGLWRKKWFGSQSFEDGGNAKFVILGKEMNYRGRGMDCLD
ncbi:hypothetical protein ACOSP7_004361 [Xanthoceras sorbifolium]